VRLKAQPYTEPDYVAFCAKNAAPLWQNMTRVDQFIDKHFISIAGQAFFCVLRDNLDGHQPRDSTPLTVTFDTNTLDALVSPECVFQRS
jgi:hypothetical protein